MTMDKGPEFEERPMREAYHTGLEDEQVKVGGSVEQPGPVERLAEPQNFAEVGEILADLYAKADKQKMETDFFVEWGPDVGEPQEVDVVVHIVEVPGKDRLNAYLADVSDPRLAE